MKLPLKIALFALPALSIAALGASVSLANKEAVVTEAASYTVGAFSEAAIVDTDDQGNTRIRWELAYGAINVSLNRNSASSANPGEALFDEILTADLVAPKFNQGNLIKVEASRGYKITQIKVHLSSWNGYTNGSYGAPRCSTSLEDDDGTYKINSVPTSITGDKKPGEQLGNQSNPSGTDKWYAFPSSADATGFDGMYVENIFTGNAYNQVGQSTSIKGIDVTYKDDDATPMEDPDTIAISAEGDATSATVGTGLQLHSLCTKNASSDGVAQKVTWMLQNNGAGTWYYNNCDIGGVDQFGVFHGFKNGTAVIKARSAKNNSIYSSTLSITVSGSKTTLNPVTFTANDLDLTSNENERNGFHAKDGFVIKTTSLSKYGDQGGYYTKGAIKFGTSASIQVMTKAGAYISRVVLCMAHGNSYRYDGKKICWYTDQTWSQTGGNATSTTTYDFGNMFVYPMTSTAYLVNISGIDKVNSITFEFNGGAYNAASFADFVLGIQPDRNDMINRCSGNTGYYRVLKDKFWASGLTDGVKTEFQNSDDPTIVSARQRYLAWASAYGDTTPFGSTITLASAKTINSSFYANDSWQGGLVVGSIVVLTFASFAFFLALRKRKKND